MIKYNFTLRELASFDYRDSVSQKTGRIFDYTYYIELIKKHRRSDLTLDEYYDFEISRYKYDINLNG